MAHTDHPLCRCAAFIFVALLTIGGAPPTSADHIAGLRATLVDQTDTTVDIDVTAYADASYPFTTLWLGVATYFYSPVLPAVDWGDGSTIPFAGSGSYTGIPIIATSTNIGGSNVHVYRGSFSHTYASTTPTTITVATNYGPGTPASTGYNVLTGNYATVAVPTYFGAYSYVYTFLTNTLQVFTPTTEIPTTSVHGLLLLALALAGAGLWLLRRF